MSAKPSPTLYDALQLAPDASTAQVREAWRRLASAHHPDRGGGQDPAAMAGINQAYEVLSDPHRRARYDAGLRPRAPRRLRTLRESAARARRVRLLLVALLPLALGGGWALARRDLPKPAPAAGQAPAEEPIRLIPARHIGESRAAPPPSSR